MKTVTGSFIYEDANLRTFAGHVAAINQAEKKIRIKILDIHDLIFIPEILIKHGEPTESYS